MGASETKETIVRNEHKEEEERVNCVDEEEHLDISIEKQLDSIKTLSISTKREESSDFETDVIIVGAGISGIKAAKSLSEKGIKVILLEANTRFGGRIWTSDFFSSDKKVNIDLGASFIHGAHNNPLYRLANELKLQIIGTGIFSDMFSADGTNMSLNEVLSKLNYNKAQKAVNISEIYQEIIGNVEKLYLKMAKEGKGEQYTTSLKYAWEQVIAKKKLNKSFFDSKKIEFQMLNFLLSGLEQYEAAPWEELSLGFYEEEELPGGDSCIKEGYGEILTHLVKNLDIRLEHEVDSILYSENSVQVSCKNGKKFQSQKCIITLPVGILQKDIVKFEPPLPSWKIESINKMGMGLMNKVVLQFESCFWKKSLYTICYASETRGKFRWFFNQYPTTESPILVGFLTTKIAHEMEEITDEEIISQALSVLDKMYPGKVTKLIKSFVTRWGKNPYSFGSYSFCKLGATPEHFKNLFKPVQDTLFFAGEHTAREYIGTVHGAYLSGIRAAINVCNSFK